MTLTFKKNADRYTAIGAFGTCYTITEENEGVPTLYYVEGRGYELDTLQEAMELCQAMEDAEDAINHCYDMGVRGFTGACCDECDIRYTPVDEVAYIYCPTIDSAKAFIQFTGYCVDCYYLSHQTSSVDATSAMRAIYQYNAHGDEFRRIDDDICAIISQLIK